MNKDGERIVISSRVAELDTIMPQYLGVSEAVLDNVIFCHQEESLWPMSEPGTLKKKFDEIFEAMKYTKAIDNIRNMKKNRGGDHLKLLKNEEANQKANKDRGQRLKKEQLDLAREIEDLREREKALTREMEEANADAKEKRIQANKALGIVDELKTKTQRAEYLQENVDRLRTNLDVLQEDNAQLESILAQHEQGMAQYHEREEEYQVQYQELQQTIAKSRRQLSERQAEKGQHQAEKDNYERQVELRAQLVKEAAHRHTMRGYDGDLDDHQIREFVDRMQKLSRDKDRELERIMEATIDETRETQNVLTELEGRRFTRTQDKVNARKAIEENDKKSRTKQRDVDSINIDEGAKAALEASRKDVQDRLSRMSDEYEAAAWDENLQTENNHLRELDDEAERLSGEAVQSGKLAQDRAQLDFIKKELDDQQRSLTTMTSTYGGRLSSIIGPDWSVRNLEREFEAVADQNSRALDDAKKQQEGTSRELSEVEYKLKSIREDIRKKREDMKDCLNAVLNSIIIDGKALTSVDDYLGELDTLQNDRNIVKGDIDNFTHLTKYYNQCLDTVQKHDKCQLCNRKFTEQRERSAALGKIRQKLAEDARDTLVGEFQTLDEQLKAATAVRVQYDIYNKLFGNELPVLEKDLKMAEDRKHNLLHIIDQQDSLVGQKESAKRDVEALAKTVNSIMRYDSEISKHEADIDRLSSQQKLSGNTMTAGEIKEKQSACMERLRSLKTKINKMNSDKDQAKTSMSTLEIELSNLSGKLNTAQYQLEKKQGLTSQLDELRDHSSQLRDDIQRADVDLESLVPQFAKAKAQHEDTQQRGRAKEKEIRVEKDRLADTVNKFKLVEDAINRYIEEGRAANLAACQRAIKTLEQEQKRIDGEMLVVTKEANELKKRIGDSDRIKRSILDNLSFRKSLRDLDVVKEEIAELESRNVTDDYEQLAREVRDAERRAQIALGKRGPVMGQIASKDEEVDRSVKRWEIEYKNAAQKYREARAQVQTTEAAIQDLGKYGDALESAIMKYHSLKMEEINRIAGELWQETYQGTDIDTIMIRSENESPTARKNYSYRVVMVKQDAEMDMRGRCSAGQKVLASIIIRLALSECFGVNCGVSPSLIIVTNFTNRTLKIIALDEPTTNLDQDNIKALAESLHKLIQARKQQRNFQLLVITHDEEFLKAMRSTEFADTYWRVSRDEKQKSTIERQSLADFM